MIATKQYEHMLKIKKVHKDAIYPAYATEGAACFDICSIGSGDVFGYQSMTFRTGLAFQVPKGHVMLVYGRSGHAFGSSIRLANCVGVIDSDYRGEVLIKLQSDCVDGYTVQKGERIAQAMVIKLADFGIQFVDELDETARGEGGFGSTGK